jgi:hypothetical protein
MADAVGVERDGPGEIDRVRGKQLGPPERDTRGGGLGGVELDDVRRRRVG